jgi:hypothetical protein
MPLSINVGLSRKASKDYQSTGVSINVTAELDQSLLARPNQLQAEVSNLYAQAQRALDGQVDMLGEPRQRPAQAPARPPASRYSRNGTSASGSGNGRHGGGMTDSQSRAIAAIARRVGVDPGLEARDIIGAELDDLTLRQASELIDHLKSLQPGNGRNGR